MAQSPSRMQPKRKPNHIQQPTFILSLPLSNSSYQLTIDHNSDPFRYFWCINDVTNHKVRPPTLDCTYMDNLVLPLAFVEGVNRLPRLNCFAVRATPHVLYTRKMALHTPAHYFTCCVCWQLSIVRLMAEGEGPTSSSSSDEQSRISIMYYMLYCMGHWWRWKQRFVRYSYIRSYLSNYLKTWTPKECGFEITCSDLIVITIILKTHTGLAIGKTKTRPMGSEKYS